MRRGLLGASQQSVRRCRCSSAKLPLQAAAAGARPPGNLFVHAAATCFTCRIHWRTTHPVVTVAAQQISAAARQRASCRRCVAAQSSQQHELAPEESDASNAGDCVRRDRQPGVGFSGLRGPHLQPLPHPRMAGPGAGDSIAAAVQPTSLDELTPGPAPQCPETVHPSRRQRATGAKAPLKAKGSASSPLQVRLPPRQLHLRATKAP